MRKFLIFVFVLTPFFCSFSQTKNSYLKVNHNTTGSATTDEMLFDGGEIQILNETVNIVFALEPSDNKAYQFDKIVSFEFETRTELAINAAKVKSINLFVDRSGLLHISANNAIGQVYVYSATGVLVAQQDSQSDSMEINLSSVPKGLYIVKVGNYINKIAISR